MKISKDTINVLKNFAQISNNFRFDPGNVLTTISPQQNIFARCTVPDTFPQTACIYNLNSLLELLSIMENQDVEFSERQLSISKDGGRFDYTYADPSVIIAPPVGKSIELDNHYEFALTAADVIMINKAAGISGAEQIVVRSEAGQAVLTVGDKARSMAHSKTLGACDKTFSVALNVENFKVMPEAYRVTLSRKKFLHFKSEAQNVPEYWLALDPSSTIE